MYDDTRTSIQIVRSTVFCELFEGLPKLHRPKRKMRQTYILEKTVYEFKLKHLTIQFNYEKLKLSYSTNWWKNN
jgi:hypothetical protein